jgi:hypothetical protein
MNINIDNSTNIMRWEHENISYEYIIDSTGRAFAYISGDYIFIEIYNEGCSFHRVISVKGENIIWYSDLGEVNIFTDSLVTLHFSGFRDLCVASPGYYVLTDTQLIKINNFGKEIFKIPSPSGYKFLRFFSPFPLSVICEQITDTSDKYGRNEWRFEFDSALLEWKLISVVQ